MRYSSFIVICAVLPRGLALPIAMARSFLVPNVGTTPEGRSLDVPEYFVRDTDDDPRLWAFRWVSMGHEEFKEGKEGESGKPLNPSPSLTPTVSPIIGLSPNQIKLNLG
ncbi:hypothetical protein FA13DRAFT_1391173 [Coprinellus micaceus]|uniref:Uncharacterized protein n=1 Tax=Coprinellus micaceus TaxID=71717 RepID=A0A4Y7SQJ0_COPMI|nr:hypothetical protein FA13DRAFT_1391173 [Coprinellus micaceus]